MPYDSVDDLSDKVRNNLSDHEAEIFVAAFNSAFKRGEDESTCFKIAWAAARKSISLELFITEMKKIRNE